MFEYKQFYRRKLPHIHSPGSTLFLTFRLFGSVPKAVLRRWKAERKMINATVERLAERLENDPSNLGISGEDQLKEFNRRWFKQFEEILHKGASGPIWLKNPTIAEIVADSLHYLNDKSYILHAFCIMSNHVHAVFTPFLNERSLRETRESGRVGFISDDPTLAAIMQSLKGYTAREANKILCRSGSFWAAESYDHTVRNDAEFERIVKYVLNNPVKAGLVNDWQEWPYCWAAKGLGNFQ